MSYELQLCSNELRLHYTMRITVIFYVTEFTNAHRIVAMFSYRKSEKHV